MRYKTFRRRLATVAVSFLFCLAVLFTPKVVVHASGETEAAETVQDQEETQLNEDTEDTPVVILEDKVPLGLETREDFEQYKRDAFVIMVFGGMIVLLTVLATKKKNTDKEKFN